MMLLGIWLVLGQHVPNLNLPKLGALVYVDIFTRDSIHERGEEFLKFPFKVFLGICVCDIYRAHIYTFSSK
jgi:hypothetical protein